MVKSRKFSGKKLKEMIMVCQNALNGKTKIEETDLLSYFPSLRSEIKKGKFDYSSIKAFSLSSRVLNLKTRKLLGEFFQSNVKANKIPIKKLFGEYSIEAALTHPINSFKDFIIEEDIVNAYFELLKNRKSRQNYSVSENKEICPSRQNGFTKIDSFEQEKKRFFIKLTNFDKKNIDFYVLQDNWEEAVVNLIYLVHLAQEGKVTLEQKKDNGKIRIKINN
ncbi:MAG: hypothetical protein ACTSRG_00280 [Candidatus Helarchaeota archaeon]